MTAKARLPPPTSHQKKKLSPLSTHGQVRCGILCSPLLSHGGPGSGCQGQGWSGLASTVSFFLPSLRIKLWNLELSLRLNVPSNQQIPPRSRQLQVKDFGEEEEENVAREGMKPLTSEGESFCISLLVDFPVKGKKREVNTRQWNLGCVRTSLSLTPMGLSFPGLYSMIYGAVLGDEFRAEGSLEVHLGVRVQILAEIGLNGENQ